MNDDYFKKINNQGIDRISKHFDDLSRVTNFKFENAFKGLGGIAEFKIRIPDYEKTFKQLDNRIKFKTPIHENVFKGLGGIAEFKIKIPNYEKTFKQFDHLAKVKSLNFEHAFKQLDSIGKFKTPDFEKTFKQFDHLADIKKLNLNTVFSINDVLLENFDEISKIDWKNNELTYEDYEEATEILGSIDAAEKVSEEFKKPKKIAVIKSIVIFIYALIPFLADLSQLYNFSQEVIIPATEKLLYQEQQGSFASDKQLIKWLSYELESDVSSNITNNFRIVIQDGLIVREGKKVDSRIRGSLNIADVVQIVEKKKNWTYIFYSDYENDEVIEGWVFTRYLKQIDR